MTQQEALIRLEMAEEIIDEICANLSQPILDHIGRTVIIAVSELKSCIKYDFPTTAMKE